MASKKQLAEQVIRILAGGTPNKDFPIDVREVMHAIEQERDLLIYNYLSQKFARGDYQVEGNLLSTYRPLSLSEDSYADGTTMPKVELPVVPISLPDNRGIYSFGFDSAPYEFSYNDTDDASSRPFVPLRGHSGIYHGTGANYLGGRNGFHIQGKTVYIQSLDEIDEEAKFKVVLIAATRNISDEVTLPLTAELESALVKSMVELFSVMIGRPEDEINDNIK